ncbi:MAG: respiratory nitrate reductase subunit gamma [Alphaproteobacteria bacterium]|nr:respiratory nitrate reductase subunit gamma [Alphaproteobacteria bacterium]MDD9919070.1 respiratory nitrate reductase subunit gamma [Alphaproteobacteria bacterium]
MNIATHTLPVATALDTFFFGLYPYICLTVCVVGCVLRLDRAPYTWRAKSSQFLRKKHFIMASHMFHAGIILLMMGHFVGLLTPHWLYEGVFGVSAALKQKLAMGAGGVFGLMCLVGVVMLLWRRLTDPRVRATSSFADIAVLVILLVQLLLGLGSIPVSASHADGGRMVELGEWAQHIVTFRPDAAIYVAGAEWVFKLHIILGLTIFLIFPFTRLVHMLSVPVGYLFRRSPQIVRKRARS